MIDLVSPAIPVGSPAWMYYRDCERQNAIEQAIVDIKAYAQNHEDIVRILGTYGLKESTMTAAECEYVNKMINS